MPTAWHLVASGGAGQEVMPKARLTRGQVSDAGTCWPELAGVAVRPPQLPWGPEDPNPELHRYAGGPAGKMEVIPEQGSALSAIPGRGVEETVQDANDREMYSIPN